MHVLVLSDDYHAFCFVDIYPESNVFLFEKEKKISLHVVSCRAYIFIIMSTRAIYDRT